MSQGRLFIFASAPVQLHPDGVLLDTKFVQGMARHVAHWDGPVTCALRQRDHVAIPFGSVHDPEKLGFTLVLVPEKTPISAYIPPNTRLIAAAADDHEALDLASWAQAQGVGLVYSLEYTLEARLRVAWLDNTRGVARRLWSMLWTIRQERRRRKAIRAADGAQFNGYPAHDIYRTLNRNPMMYLDNRMSSGIMATRAEMGARARRLRAGAPLRLIHSGRLEPLKGAQDLLPVMAALRQAGVRATLDIYGTGSLEGQIRDGLAAFDGDVRLHAPVDFVEELVPINRHKADLFLSCHRQSDPSCTYLEAMGCGLPVAGYDNRMWRQLCARSGGGVAVRMGQRAALAQAIAGWDRDREALIARAEAGLEFARGHDFEGEFKRRMDHLRDVCQGLARGEA